MGNTCRTLSSFPFSFGQSSTSGARIWLSEPTYGSELSTCEARICQGGEGGLQSLKSDIWQRASIYEASIWAVSGMGGRSWGLEFRKEKSGRYVKFWKPEPSKMATGWKLLVKIPVTYQLKKGEHLFSLICSIYICVRVSLLQYNDFSH